MDLRLVPDCFRELLRRAQRLTAQGGLGLSLARAFRAQQGWRTLGGFGWMLGPCSVHTARRTYAGSLASVADFLGFGGRRCAKHAVVSWTRFGSGGPLGLLRSWSGAYSLSRTPMPDAALLEVETMRCYDHYYNYLGLFQVLSICACLHLCLFLSLSQMLSAL